MPEPLIRIDSYSHGARLFGYDSSMFHKLTQFLEGLALKEPRRLPRGGIVMELKKRFYGLTDNHREVFIHRNHLKPLLSFLHNRGVPAERIQINTIAAPKATPITVVPKPQFVPRDYQLPIIEALCRDIYSTRLDLYTGGGKTATTLMAAAKRGERIVIMIPPKYFGIWIKALNETYLDMEGRYVTVSGSAELQMIINQGIEGTLTYDVLIISMVTYRSYLESYEKFGSDIVNMGYAVPPPRFHEAIGAGFQINDEIQEDPGLVFRIDIFSNVKKQAYLSATPFTGSDFVTRMIDVMIPPEETGCELPEYKAYIQSIAVQYNDPQVQPKDYLTPFKNTYNHARYETRMMKSKRRLERYFEMVVKLANGLFVRDRVPGQKLLILCATVKFIEALTKHLQQCFPHLTVNAYVQGVSYQTLLKSDITISTIKSSGTGVDIPNLRELILLQATDSKKDNIQILGRLRPLKDFPDVTPRFTYLVCMDIPQSIKYAANKRAHFDGRVIGHRTLRI